VDALLSRFQSGGPAEKRAVMVRLKNLPPVNSPAVEKAAARGDLPADCLAAVRAALPTVTGRARVAARAEADRQENVRLALAAYDEAGKKDAKWDATVREAIELASAPARDDAKIEAQTSARVAAALKKAVDAGCDDPFARYLLAAAEAGTSGGGAGAAANAGAPAAANPGAAAGPAANSGARNDALTRFRQTVLDLAGTNYPAHVKVRAAAGYFEASKRADAQVATICQQHLAAALAGPERGWRWAYELADLAFNAVSEVRGLEDALTEIMPVYEKARPDDDPGPHLLAGIRSIDFAWEARGNGLANTVTPVGWKQFKERLVVARRALEAAFKRDADDARAPMYMITVCMGEGSNRAEMEKWFKRTMAASPDAMNACRRKLAYLYPRWHGSNEEMLAFGRECAATGNWWGPLPEILIEAYEEIAKFSTGDAKALYRAPATWRDMNSVYGAFLEAYPDSPRAPHYRNLLAKWACHCERWEVAAKLFAQIGDDRDQAVFRSKAVYDYWRRKAARKVAPTAEQVRADR
jgi:hypothetical protein